MSKRSAFYTHSSLITMALNQLNILQRNQVTKLKPIKQITKFKWINPNVKSKKITKYLKLILVLNSCSTAPSKPCPSKCKPPSCAPACPTTCCTPPPPTPPPTPPPPPPPPPPVSCPVPCQYQCTNQCPAQCCMDYYSRWGNNMGKRWNSNSRT